MACGPHTVRRPGGGEFIVLLPEVRKAEHPAIASSQRHPHVTKGPGVSMFPDIFPEVHPCEEAQGCLFIRPNFPEDFAGLLKIGVPRSIDCRPTVSVSLHTRSKMGGVLHVGTVLPVLPRLAGNLAANMCQGDSLGPKPWGKRNARLVEAVQE
jgi:hypothetical protein